jgi:hypothetical protein
MKRDAEVEAVITRAMSAAEIMNLTGHNKGTIYKVLNRLINENKIKKTKLRYAPTGYSDKFISNERTPWFCADPFGLSGLQDARDLQSKLRGMQTKTHKTGIMQGLAVASERSDRKVRWS